MKTSEPKPKQCAMCVREFYPRSTLHSVCSQRCAMKKLKAKAVEEKAELKARKQALKKRTEWMAECQTILNKYARLRDRNDGCISCDRPATWDGQWHGSHFRSVGAASGVRFNLWNIHKACSICNNHLSGNIAGYRPRLLAKMGATKVEWLEAQTGVVRYEIDYLKRLKAVMGKRLKRLEKRIEI